MLFHNAEGNYDDDDDDDDNDFIYMYIARIKCLEMLSCTQTNNVSVSVRMSAVIVNVVVGQPRFCFIFWLRRPRSSSCPVQCRSCPSDNDHMPSSINQFT